MTDRSTKFEVIRNRCFEASTLLPILPDEAQTIITQTILPTLINGLPKVCVTFDFKFCSSSPHLKLNITVDGEIVVMPEVTDETEICLNLGESGCKACVGIKKG